MDRLPSMRPFLAPVWVPVILRLVLRALLAAEERARPPALEHRVEVVRRELLRLVPLVLTVRVVRGLEPTPSL